MFTDLTFFKQVHLHHPLVHWASVTSQRTPRGLCASTIELSLRLYCNYLSYLSATTDFNWRCLGPNRATTANPIRLYCVFIIKPSHGASFMHAQSKRRRRAFLATLPRVQWRCRCGALPMLVYLPCAPLRSAFFRDAAGSPYERSPGVTRVWAIFRDRGITWCCLYVNLHIIIF